MTGRIAIIGHRGIGKTSLLRRYEDAYRSAGKRLRGFDLDREIEHHTGRTIQDLFQNDGEAVFRRLEKEVLTKIEKETAKISDDVVIVCGAGFDPSQLGSQWRALWVRRMTDKQGRIFTDRPRLNADVSPLEEYQERFESREKRFAERAEDTFWLDEGIEDAADLSERAYLLDELSKTGGAATLLPEHFKHDIAKWISKRSRWGLTWFELRDDLLTPEQFRAALMHIPHERALLSFRSVDREGETAGWIDRLGLSFDWPLERGECPHGTPRYLSLHERVGDSPESLTAALARFPKNVNVGTQLKAALPIYSLKELEIAHRWQMSKSSERIFLPMSESGQWTWYRLLRAGDYSLNFLRESSGSSIDQPTLLQWIRRRSINGEHFAAILGDPVQHSRTPMEHSAYFRKLNANVYAIRVSEAEATPEVMGFLRELGLRWAAVTAPLKRFAFSLCSGLSERAESLRSVNTLVFDQERGVWAGTNTDYDGFQEAVKDCAKELQEPIAVWGGGGTLEVIRAVLPHAECFSVRTGENRKGSVEKAYRPQTVVWAIGRSRDLKMPPSSWNPKLVLDLNYSDDSPGREYALSSGAKYVSGLAMFKAQASIQRSFWTEAAQS